MALMKTDSQKSLAAVQTYLLLKVSEQVSSF